MTVTKDIIKLFFGKYLGENSKFYEVHQSILLKIFLFPEKWMLLKTLDLRFGMWPTCEFPSKKKLENTWVRHKNSTMETREWVFDSVKKNFSMLFEYMVVQYWTLWKVELHKKCEAQVNEKCSSNLPMSRRDERLIWLLVQYKNGYREQPAPSWDSARASDHS